MDIEVEQVSPGNVDVNQVEEVAKKHPTDAEGGQGGKEVCTKH